MVWQASIALQPIGKETVGCRRYAKSVFERYWMASDHVATPTFSTLVSYSITMAEPTVRVPQCYDLERAAAELPADASRLKVVGHSLTAVASLPHRLANPPPRDSKLE